MILSKKIKDILQYVGIIGSAMMSIAYIVIVLVLVQGFNTDISIKNTSLFAIVNAAVGLIIMQLLKIQGVAFAKSIPENEAILTQYYNTKTKERKLRSIKWYWWTSVTKDVVIKGLSLAISTFGFIYIVIQGSHDYHLLLLAVVNLIMFICFGLLALNSAYEFYNNEHIPYIKEKLKESTSEDMRTVGLQNSKNFDEEVDDNDHQRQSDIEKS